MHMSFSLAVLTFTCLRSASSSASVPAVYKPTVTFTVNTAERVVKKSTVPGVAIDTYSLQRGLDWSSPALLGPAKQLRPPLLRVGGSAQRSYAVCFGDDHPERCDLPHRSPRTHAFARMSDGANPSV